MGECGGVWGGIERACAQAGVGVARSSAAYAPVRRVESQCPRCILCWSREKARCGRFLHAT